MHAPFRKGICPQKDRRCALKESALCCASRRRRTVTWRAPSSTRMASATRTSSSSWRRTSHPRTQRCVSSPGTCGDTSRPECGLSGASGFHGLSFRRNCQRQPPEAFTGCSCQLDRLLATSDAHKDSAQSELDHDGEMLRCCWQVVAILGADRVIFTNNGIAPESSSLNAVKGDYIAKVSTCAAAPWQITQHGGARRRRGGACRALNRPALHTVPEGVALRAACCAFSVKTMGFSNTARTCSLLPSNPRP